MARMKVWMPLVITLLVMPASVSRGADSDPAHVTKDTERPLPWPDGIIPYDVSHLSEAQQILARQAMQRWMDTGARVAFVTRTTQTAYVNFTGRTDAGNNTSQTGYKPGAHNDINITAFWWRQGEWMPAHELGHALGFHHEHARWDRDAFVIIHYENIKDGRSADYDWIPKTNWLVTSTPYDYYSIMHYRVCWASRCESECRDADGASPCVVIDPVGTVYDKVIGQWSDNGISPTDGEKAKAAYGSAKTIYVQAEAASTGCGTLQKPYPDLAQARHMELYNVRFIVLAKDGSFSSVIQN